MCTTLERADAFPGHSRSPLHTLRVWSRTHRSGTMLRVPGVWTTLAKHDCSSGRFDPGGPPCPEPQVQYGLAIMLVIAAVVLVLAALWWWGMKRRYRQGRKLLPQIWLLAIGPPVLILGALTLFLVLP
jgi:hypothetical protein